jgi:hypothetical protein
MVSVFERMSKRKPSAARLLAVAAAFAPGTATVAAATTVAATASVVVVTSAVAGEYHVYSCRTPAGESAPADGWSRSEAGPEAFADDTCSQPGGALIAALRAGTARTANVDSATWAFEAPAGETLAGATLWRAGDADGGAAPSGAFYEFWLAGPTVENVFEDCLSISNCPGKGNIGQPLSEANPVTVPAANLGSNLYLTATCGGLSKFECLDGPSDPNGYAAVVYLYAADLTLEQATSPTESNVSGELASAATVAGTSDVAFDASDPGSGVYEAVFTVDGEVVQRTVVDEDEGRCRNVGQTTDGLPAFLYVQPCPASVSADVGFDTTAVANGEHHLVVSVIDAAGNAATVLDRNVTIDNPPAPGSALGPSEPGGPNGRNASSRATLTVGWKGARGERVTRAYGRARTIVGRLTGVGGAPIEGARIEVLARPDYAGAKAAAMASPLTGADGRFSVSVPAGVSSRTLRLQYSDELGSPPVATRTLTLSVRAGVALAVAPRTASVGSSIHFSGRLRGGPIPAGGKLLVLEARSPGAPWLEFDVIRSDSRGRFHASYRFKFPGPAEYQFRVLCEAEADYPFATGASNVVGVFEG